MRIFLLLQITLFLATSSWGQVSKQIQQIEELYAINIQQTHINDVYIPIDVDEAMVELDRLSDEAGRSKFLETDEDNAARVLIKGLGRWMIVNWNFYDGSRLSHYLKEMGVSHPNDMAKFLIVSYHRYLRGAEQEYAARAKIYEEQRKADQEKRNAELQADAQKNYEKGKGGY